MKRRNLLGLFAVTAGGILLPEYEPVRTFSFVGGWRKGEVTIYTKDITSSDKSKHITHPWFYNEDFVPPPNEEIFAISCLDPPLYFMQPSIKCSQTAKYTNFRYEKNRSNTYHVYSNLSKINSNKELEVATIDYSFI